MCKRQILMAALISIFINAAFAKDLGVHGAVYAIKEKNLLQVIQQKVAALQQSGEVEKLAKQFNQSMQQQMDRPKPASGLKRALRSHTWLFDPSTIIPYDLKDAEGHVVIPAGSRINPLDTIALTETLLFYNADDLVQVKWAQQIDKQLKGNDKLILVSGSVFDQAKIFNKPVFFDQEGRLVNRFHISQVPALITQQAKHLKIQEVSL